MNIFFEDSSQAKMLTNELSYRYALRHMRNTEPCAYELRDYSRTPYFVINTFVTKESALVAKSFHEIQEGCHFAVVAVNPSYSFIKSHISSPYGMLTQSEMDYINSDKELTDNLVNQRRGVI